MAILDQVIQMQQEGRTNPEILRSLEEQGISAKEVNDAINQAQIKGALNESTMENQEQPSVMTGEIPQQETQMPQQAPQAPQVPVQPQEDYYAQTPQGYDQNYNAGGYGAGTVDPDSVTEIAQQVVEEEFKNYKKKTGDMAAFKTSTDSKLEELGNRIKRLEATIDKIQQAVIQKVGEFGENTNYIRKDLENLHNTTSKLMNPLIDNLNATTKHSTHKKTSKKKTSKK
jgi:hypothetical protein